MNLILASNSPRRKEILNHAGYNFKIIPSNYDEKFKNSNYSKEKIENCAKEKALNVAKSNNGIIIAADTVVVLDNIILGKPKNKDNAINMLLNLSNRTHFVATSICLIYKDKILKDTDITYVTFRKLNKTEIIKYIEEKNPLDKAGSYGIQDEGFDFAVNIKGETDNVIGFPLKLFKNLLNDMQRN